MPPHLTLGIASGMLESCQRDVEILDSQAFALIVEDLKTLALATAEVNPGGLSRTVCC